MSNRKSLLVPVATVLAMALTASACSSEPENPRVPDYPHSANKLIFALRPSQPGKIPYSFWLYGDGRVFLIDYRTAPASGTTSGGADKPQRVDPVPIRTTKVSQAEINSTLRILDRIGLLDKSVNLGKPAKSTGSINLLINAGGTSKDVSYAVPQNDYDPNISDKQERYRGWIIDIAKDVEEQLSNKLANYNPDRIAFLTKKIEQPDSRDGTVHNWPLASLDRTADWEGTSRGGSRCLIVDSNQAGTVMDTLRSTEQAVSWRSSGDLYRVWLHPLLPDEKDCGSLHTYFSTTPDN